MRRGCLLALIVVGLGVLSVRTASAQAAASGAMVGHRLRVDADRLFPPESRAARLAHDPVPGVDPIQPFQPLLDRLPLQLIPELLRTSQRLTLKFDRYQVRPRVGLHEVAIVVTRPLSQ